MNWTALVAVLILAAGAAVVWLALAARLVANEERAKERAEAERRRMDMLRESAEQERRSISNPASAPGPAPADRGAGSRRNNR